MAGLQVVFGAGGGAGGAVVRALAEQGESVRAVTRSGANVPAGVESVDAAGHAGARLVFRAHEDGRVQATIGRGSDFFGPGATNTVAGMLVFSAVVAGKKAHWLGSLDQPHSQHFVDDFARGLVALERTPPDTAVERTLAWYREAS